jgi:hypothetical protein
MCPTNIVSSLTKSERCLCHQTHAPQCQQWETLRQRGQYLYVLRARPDQIHCILIEYIQQESPPPNLLHTFTVNADEGRPTFATRNSRRRSISPDAIRRTTYHFGRYRDEDCMAGQPSKSASPEAASRKEDTHRDKTTIAAQDALKKSKVERNANKEQIKSVFRARIRKYKQPTARAKAAVARYANRAMVPYDMNRHTEFIKYNNEVLKQERAKRQAASNDLISGASQLVSAIALPLPMGNAASSPFSPTSQDNAASLGASSDSHEVGGIASSAPENNFCDSGYFTPSTSARLDAFQRENTPINSFRDSSLDISYPSNQDVKAKDKQDRDDTEPAQFGYEQPCAEQQNDMLASFTPDMTMNLRLSPSYAANKIRHSFLRDDEEDPDPQVGLRESLQIQSKDGSAAAQDTESNDSGTLVIATDLPDQTVLVDTATRRSNTPDFPTNDKSLVRLAKLMLKPGDNTTSIGYLMAILTPEEIDNHQRLSSLSKAECTTRIISFLEQNMSVLESFKMSSTVRIGSDGKKTAQHILANHWYDPRTRFEICGAVKWIDGLLEVFRKEIVAEDRSVLLPKLHLMDQQRELMVEKDRNEAAKVYSNSAADQTARKNYAATSALQWAAFDKQYETIKTSNSKRNDLLLATNFPTSLIEEISFPASIIAVNDPFFETEEVVIEALRQTLQRISDTISCNDQKLLNETRANPKVPKADNNIPLDGVLYMNEQDLRFFAVGKHPVQMIPKVEEEDGDFDPTTKYAYLADFPPNIQTVLPGGISVSLNADSKQISERDQNGVDNDRTKLLDDLTPAEFHIWMQGFLSHIPLLMEGIPEATKGYDAYVPIAQRQLAKLRQLAYNETDEDKRLRNGLIKEVEYRLKRVEAQEIWPRDRAYLILRRMRRDTNRWLASPNRRAHVESAEIGQLHAQIDAFEEQLKKIRPYKAVEFGWVFAPCPRVNKAGGCPDRQEGLCLFNHWNEGKTCDSVMKNIACEFGGGCVKLHVAPSDQSSRPQTPMSGRSFDMPSGSFPGTPTSSTYPCPHVNKPGGCADESKCTFHHRNSGRICQNFRDSGRCNRGRNCAFVHPGDDNTTSSVSPRTDKNTDLRPILDQVLSDPRKYWVCSYANKGAVGCFKEKNPGGCPFNHTLSGVQCPDDNGKGGCHRRLLCPLRHSPVSFRGSQSGKRRADESHAHEAAPAKRPRPSRLSLIPSMGALGHNQQQNPRSSSPSSRFPTSDSVQYGAFRSQGRPQAQHFREQQNSQSTGHNPFYPNVTPHFSQGYQQQLPQSPVLDPLLQNGALQSAGRAAYDLQGHLETDINRHCGRLATIRFTLLELHNPQVTLMVSGRPLDHPQMLPRPSTTLSVGMTSSRAYLSSSSSIKLPLMLR